MHAALMLVSLLAPSLLAQGLRDNAVGEVRDRANAAWVGAEVVLVSRPIPADDGLGSEDRVVATTDERGRFHAPIVAGRPYTVWAWGAETAAGRQVTAVAERVFAQEPVLLREARMVAARTLVLDHADRWQGHDGYRVRIVQQTGNRQVEWRDVVDGRVALPPLLADARVGLFVRKGGFAVPLLAGDVGASETGDVHLEVPEAAAAVCELNVAGDQKARAGARAFRWQDRVLYPVGNTDDQGRLGLDLPIGGAARRGMVVSAEGRMLGLFGQSSASPARLSCTTNPGRTLHLRVVGKGGLPVAGLTAWLTGLATNHAEAFRAQSMFVQRSFTTDGNGAICVDGLHVSGEVSLHMVLDENTLAALPEPWRHGMAPVVVAPLATATGAGTADDPLVVDLLRMSPVQLQFTGAAGTPLDGVDVALCTLHPFLWGPWGTDTGDNGMAADARGRLRALVPAGLHLGMRAVCGTRVLIRAIEALPACPTAAPGDLTMEMPPPSAIRGRLLLPSGQPAAGRVMSASFAVDNTPAEWTFTSQPGFAPGHTDRNAVRIVLPEDKQEQLMLTGLIEVRCVSAADGSFAYPLPPETIPGLTLFEHRVGVNVMTDSRTFAWKGEEITGVEWTVER